MSFYRTTLWLPHPVIVSPFDAAHAVGPAAVELAILRRLARRDAGWMGRIYNFLGLSVGRVGPDIDDAEAAAVSYPTFFHDARRVADPATRAVHR